jgi:hypothetical protein
LSWHLCRVESKRSNNPAPLSRCFRQIDERLVAVRGLSQSRNGVASFAKQVDEDGRDKFAFRLLAGKAMLRKPTVQDLFQDAEFSRPKGGFEKILHIEPVLSIRPIWLFGPAASSSNMPSRMLHRQQNLLSVVLDGFWL